MNEAPIPLYTPEIRGNEWQYVKECLDTGWVSSVGSYVDRFEKIVADRAGVAYAVATMNGTAALHMALLLAGVRHGDEVLVSTLTFVASANAVRYTGATPVFIDAEPHYWQMDANLVEGYLRDRCERRNGEVFNRETGRRISAIVPVHVLGHPVDLDAICEIGQRYNIPVVEDAAEGLGVKYRGKPVGGLATVGCISFNGNKLITTGGGGMIVTNDPELAKRARYLTTTAKDDPIEYVHGDVGYNYRMTNVLAAIGCAQIENLDEFVSLKRQRAAEYREQLEQIPGISFYRESSEALCTYWMNTIFVDAEEYGLTSRQLLNELQKRGIQTRPLWQPMHLSPAHRDCPAMLSGIADDLYANCLSLPSSVGLTAAQVNRVCRTIAELRESKPLRQVA